ncbi:rare lipoprotein A [Cadophora sp. MPI-SDFR-AT-0126]|nr:rare lipoprotein A [Leotiomycetes sp. MPI-SDFR-AT-0126]
MHFSTSIAIAAVALPLAYGSVLAERATSGIATWYDGAVGACSFDGYTYPTGVYGTALGLNLWNTAAQCGGCVSITNASGKKITAMIVDECPGGCAGKTFDLFPTAFSSLALPSAGEIPITWDYITCPITTPFKLRTKTGSSQWWFAIQVYNANQAITKLEVSADEGKTWKACVRQTYNYWLLASGTGSATVQVRVTAKDGKVVVTKNVPTAEGQTVTAASNFV